MICMPEKVRKEIADIDNKCYVSIASLWEIAIKIRLGKLSIKFPFEKFATYLSDNEIELLPISLEHLLQLLNLDLHHRDPFERLIIAQAIPTISRCFPGMSISGVIRKG